MPKIDGHIHGIVSPGGEEFPDRHGNHFMPGGIRLGQQAKHLKSFTAYYKFNDGDMPVTIAAVDIKEASKLAMLPGVAITESMEPSQIKYDGKTVGISMPVNMVGFDVMIDPPGAEQAGACATPEHFDVINGENVIFSAKEPFGYTFDGWYKSGVAEKISDAKVAEIEVYDKFSTKLQYVAKFIHKPSFRSGRYLDLTRGNLITFNWVSPEPEDPPYAFVTWDSGTLGSFSAIIQDKDFESDVPEIVFKKDPSVAQPGDLNMRCTVSYSPVGVNLSIVSVSSDNPWGYAATNTISLQYLNSFEGRTAHASRL